MSQSPPVDPQKIDQLYRANQFLTIKNNIMKKQEFTISINAAPENVWKILWSNDTYTQWTAPFAEGSQVKTDWQKGSQVLFHDGNNNGMMAEIADIVPNQYMSFKHRGMVKDGVEEITNPEWAGAFENYTLENKDGKTNLIVDIDLNEEYMDYFLDAFPKALQKVKELSEQQ
jgi:uncharacterized protein YndB with AHSA1/START domain